ncbi:phospho-sugar mutase [Gulosibacter molinativorax]|uniref:Phospho-sugar mutase n=1 Tax=Gulosibacter molinativorax TaxID=256821 RepID=A0ABT7C869_9MICO|nr:phospho-sugar mutase [Gulosibacter molinativorax]MDJ1371342.1 phospho-sugar mutase [Gulosibacter molinativorax]QUY63594.1 Putative phosphomannomutase [Gulosibacter molinativorax]
MNALPLNRESQVAFRHAAESWLAQDPDPETRAELESLLAQAGDINKPGVTLQDADDSPGARAWRELRDRFGTRLSFGTAGLRGRQAAGSNRMNRVTVAQAARGLADYLVSRGGSPSVVIGYDARINSDVYARDTAELMMAAGVKATLLPRPLPTPVLAFAVRWLGTSAGIMVTASHNPKWDNGYKVYLGDEDQGSQIVPPADKEIATAIANVANTMKVPDLPRSQDYETAPESLVAAYITETAKVFQAPVVPLKVAYTPLHGVGRDTFRAVLEKAGVPLPEIVKEQADPDGTFPTVDFPNPEEPGALDLAYATGDATGASLILAHDPDADRLAVAVRVAEGWRLFGGNEIGRMLGWRAAKAAAASGQLDGTLATSLVSSPALSKIAERYGLGYAETQTGFKWISRAPGIIYGYEEALGYLVNTDTVRDKDGVSAALAILELAMLEAAKGRTLDDLDNAFTEEFGAYESRQVALRYESVDVLPKVMAGLRAKFPEQVGDVAVATAHDLETDPQPANIIRLELADDTRIMIRPSGTEPKIKVYIDANSISGTVAERKASAASRADAAASAMRAMLTQ